MSDTCFSPREKPLQDSPRARCFEPVALLISSNAMTLHAAMRAALFVTVFSMQAPSGLTPDERSLAGYIDSHNHEALALLERVVNINSGTQNYEGVKEVGRAFRDALDALGFTTRWVDGAPFSARGISCRSSVRRAADPPHRHLDTVFEKDSVSEVRSRGRADRPRSASST